MSVPVWLTGIPSTLSNRITWRLSAALAASLALLATILTLRYPRNGTPHPPAAPPAALGLPTLALTPQMERLEVPAGHLNRLIGFCSSMVTTDRSFVVFSNGTCVIVSEPSPDPIAEAVTILGECSSPNARFITKEIEHGNVLVTYSKPAFHCMFGDEIELNRFKLEAAFTRYLTQAEKSLVTPGWEPPFHAKLGLIARHRLNEDATHLRIAKVIKARPVVTTSTEVPHSVSLEGLTPGN